MKLTKHIYFYEGDYLNKKRIKYSNYYRGIGSSNFLVLKGKEQVLLDSGMHIGPHIPRQSRQLKEDGISLLDTTKVIFSHAHPDHILYAKKLSKQKKIDFYMHEHNEHLTVSSDYFFEAFFNFPNIIQREIYKIPKPIAKIILKAIGYNFEFIRVKEYFDDDIPFNFDISIKPVDLSGHSKGHHGFYFPGEKVFYSADLFDIRANPGTSIGNADSDYIASISDIEKVMNLDIECLVPGHGRLIEGRKNIKSFLESLLINTKGYTQKILEYLPLEKTQAITLSQLTKIIYKDSISANGFTRHIITYNCLKHLQRQKSVKQLFSSRKIRWYQQKDLRN